MSPDFGFVAFLGVTVVLLGGVVATGLRRRLRVHLVLVALAVSSLGATIWFAEQLGELYDLEAAGWVKPLHLTLAKLTTAAYLLPIGTGFATLRDRRRRPLHFKAAMAVLALTAVATGTGIWMLLAAERLP